MWMKQRSLHNRLTYPEAIWMGKWVPKATKIFFELRYIFRNGFPRSNFMSFLLKSLELGILLKIILRSESSDNKPRNDTSFCPLPVYHSAEREAQWAMHLSPKSKAFVIYRTWCYPCLDAQLQMNNFPRMYKITKPISIIRQTILCHIFVHFVVKQPHDVRYHKLANHYCWALSIVEKWNTGWVFTIFGHRVKVMHSA